MANWQLGNAEAAREDYDQAVSWMDQHAPNNEELLRFKAEAAALLGITPVPGAPPASPDAPVEAPAPPRQVDTK